MAQNTPDPLDRDSVVAATKALAEATAALTRMLGKQVGAVGEEVAGAVAEGLREATRAAASGADRTASAGRRRRERVDRTRADLLDAMADLVAARGYEGASVGDVAAAAGYTKGAVYANFGSKEDLFVSLALRESEAGRLLRARVEGPDEEDPTAGVDAALLGLEVLAYAVRHEESRDELRPVLEDELERVAGLVRDARVDRAAPTGRGARLGRGARAGRGGESDAGGEGGDVGVGQEDRDTALALVAITAVGEVLAAFSGLPHVDEGTVDRLAARLLGS